MRTFRANTNALANRREQRRFVCDGATGRSRTGGRLAESRERYCAESHQHASRCLRRPVACIADRFQRCDDEIEGRLIHPFPSSEVLRESANSNNRRSCISTVERSETSHSISLGNSRKSLEILRFAQNEIAMKSARLRDY